MAWSLYFFAQTPRPLCRTALEANGPESRLNKRMINAAPANYAPIRFHRPMANKSQIWSLWNYHFLTDAYKRQFPFSPFIHCSPFQQPHSTSKNPRYMISSHYLLFNNWESHCQGTVFLKLNIAFDALAMKVITSSRRRSRAHRHCCPHIRGWGWHCRTPQLPLRPKKAWPLAPGLLSLWWECQPQGSQGLGWFRWQFPPPL